MNKNEFELLSRDDKIAYLKRCQKRDKRLFLLNDILVYGLGFGGIISDAVVEVAEEDVISRSIKDKYNQKKLKALKEFNPKVKTEYQKSVDKTLLNLNSKELEFIKSISKQQEEETKRYRKHKLRKYYVDCALKGVLMGTYYWLSSSGKRKTNEYYEKEYKKILDSDQQKPKKK